MKLSPMKCYLGTIDDLKKPNWIYEPKLDGIRALCYINEHSKLISRTGNDLTKNYPSLLFRSSIQAQSCLLDGEIISYNAKGLPSFSTLQEGHYSTYVAFDILMLNGKSLIKKPLLERKKILEAVLKPGPSIEKIIFTHKGLLLWHIMQKKHLEGVVAKDPKSHYLPGMRNRSWIKIKFTQSIECIIVGYTQEKRSLSALALGLYDNQGKLHYVGKVGTGFNKKNIPELVSLLKPLEIKHSTIDSYSIKKLPVEIVWIQPKLVAEVKYLQFTQLSILRQSVFLRLRFDKKPQNCTFKDQGLLKNKSTKQM